MDKADKSRGSGGVTQCHHISAWIMSRHRGRCAGASGDELAGAAMAGAIVIVVIVSVGIIVMAKHRGC